MQFVMMELEKEGEAWGEKKSGREAERKEREMSQSGREAAAVFCCCHQVSSASQHALQLHAACRFLQPEPCFTAGAGT